METSSHGVSPAQQEAAGMLVHLDADASTLVRRYLEVTPWNYTVADIVSGCVAAELESAFDNQEEAERMTGLASTDYHDGAWGYTQEWIEYALCQRTGEEGADLKDENDERTQGTGRVLIELVASDLSAEELDGRQKPRCASALFGRGDHEGLCGPEPETAQFPHKLPA